MGLQKKSLNHLMNEIARVDELRHSDKAIDLLKAKELEALNIDEKAEEILGKAMDCLIGHLGKMLGIKEEHREYLRWEDLSLSEIKEILAMHVPGVLKAPAHEILKRLNRRRIGHVLTGKAFETGFALNMKTSLPLEGRLTHIATAPKSTTYSSRDGRSAEFSLTHSTTLTEQDKVRICPGQEHYPMPKDCINQPYRRIYLRGCQLERIGSHYDQKLFKSNLSGQLIYGSRIKLTRLECENTRMIDVSGKLQQMALHDCDVLAGEHFEAVGGEWIGGSLKIESFGSLRMSLQFFLGTKISLTEDCEAAPDGASHAFTGCDFSGAKISDRDLPLIARHCDHRCVFSSAQKAVLGEAGNRFLSGEEAINRMVSFAPSEEKPHDFRTIKPTFGIGRPAESLMTDDYSTDRSDIAAVPTFRKGNREKARHTRAFRQSEVTDERIFEPITSENAEHLPARIRFFRRISGFVRKQPEFSMEDMMQFIFDETANPETRLILGFHSDLSQVPKELTKLPSVKRVREVQQSYGNPKYEEEVVYIGYRTISEDSDQEQLIKIKCFPGTEHVYSGNEWERSRPTYYSYIQRLRVALEPLAESLYYYGLYLNDLIDNHGYHFPTISDRQGQAMSFRGFFHPNLHQHVEGEQIVTNNVEFLNGHQSQILALSGPNGKAGKTHFMDAIARSISQAQSGAPCPGKLTIAENDLFDHVLIMPNIRNQTGSGESGMEGRARVVLQEFTQRVKDLASPDRPARVFIGLDEIMMGVTRPDDAMVIECNFIEELMTTPGIEATIVMISPDDRVVRSLKQRFPERLTIMSPQKDRPSYQLFKTDDPMPCSPTEILEERDLGHYMAHKDWIVK